MRVILNKLAHKFGSGRIYNYGTNNDTNFKNPSSHLALSANQQERWSLPRGARLRSCRKNVQWPLPAFPSFPDPAEHQACWTKNSYYSEMMIWVQNEDTSASRSHATDSWQWSTPFKIFLSLNPHTNIQAWWVGTHSLWSEESSRAGGNCPSSPGQKLPCGGRTGQSIFPTSAMPARWNSVLMYTSSLAGRESLQINSMGDRWWR